MYSLTTKHSDTAPGSDIDTGSTAAGHDITRYITVTSPTATNEWGVADTTKVIQWDSGGAINKVSIYYSTDWNGSTGTWTAIATNLTPTPTAGGNYSASDSCSYTWSAGIPDLVTGAAQDPQTDRDIATWLKVADVVSAHTTEGDAPDDVSADGFQVCYYQVIWNVKDMSTLSHLSNLNVNEVNDDSPPSNTWSITNYSLNSPIIRNYKYDVYTSTFSKEANYFDGSESGWTADSTKNITLYLETTIEKQWFVYTNYTYDADNDRLKINTWIEKEGTLMTAPTSSTVTIYDSAGNTVDTLSSSTHRNGAFWMTADTSSWSTAEVYFATTSIVYAEATYTSGQGISITVNKALSTISASTSAIQTAVTTTIPATLTTIETAVTATGEGTIRGDIATVKSDVGTVKSQVSTISTKVGTISTNVTAIMEDTGTTLPASITETAERGVFTEILTRNTTIREDETIKIRYRTSTGLSPAMTIYDADGDALTDYDGVTMEEISSTGIYEYSITAESAWGTGDFTVVCEESSKSSKDSMVLTVKALYVAGGGVEESIDSLGYAVTKVYSRTGTIEDLLGTSSDEEGDSTVFGMVNDLEDTIDDLGLTTVATDARLAKTKALNAYNAVNDIKNQVDNIESQVSALQKLVSYVEGMKADLSSLSKRISEKQPEAIVPEAAEEKGTTEAELAAIATEEQMKDLNNKVEELTAMVKIMSELMEAETEEPVVEGWFESE